MSGDLDVYFASERFRKRLDEVRTKSSDSTDLKAYAFSVANKLGLKLNHVGVIYHYLQMGEYDPSASKSSIELIDLSKPPKYPVDADDNLGVAIELSEDTTQDDLHKFIDDNWDQIKSLLDKNYLTRKKRFTAMTRLDNYLEIADVLNSAKPGANKASRAKEMAAKHRMETREVYRIAKEYRSILVE